MLRATLFSAALLASLAAHVQAADLKVSIVGVKSATRVKLLVRSLKVTSMSVSANTSPFPSKRNSSASRSTMAWNTGDAVKSLSVCQVKAR